MEETLSPRTDSSHRVATIRVLGVVLVLVILAIVAAVLFVPIKGMSLFERFQMARSLDGLLVAEEGYESIAPQSFGMFGVKEKDVAVEGRLGDYAAVSGAKVAIVRSTESGAQEIVRVSPDASALVRDPSDKAALAVAPGGAHYAYAVRVADEEASEPADSFSGWHVHLYDVASGVATDFGEGFAPEFFERDGKLMLLFTSAEGMVLVDTESSNSSLTAFPVAANVLSSASVSPDGKYLALPDDAMNGATALYEVVEASVGHPLDLTLLGHAKDTLSDVAFVNGNAYGVTLPDETSTAWLRSYDLTALGEGEGTTVTSFPASVPQRLIR